MTSTRDDKGRGPQADEEDSVIIGRLLAAGRDGDYRLMMTRYGPMVRAHLCQRSLTATIQEDLFQEVFTTAFLHLEKLRNHRRFGPWLMRIARSKVVDHIRAEGRRIPAKMEGPQEEAGESDIPAPEGADPASRSSYSETRSVISAEIGKLGEKYRLVLHMRLLEGEEPAAIARALGAKESTVRMRLKRGLAKLRKALTGKGLLSD